MAGPDDDRPLAAQSFGDQIDRACDQFEAAWKAGQEPRIEEYLALVGTEDGFAARALSVELMCLELEYRWRQPKIEAATRMHLPEDTAGKCAAQLNRPFLSDYAARHPQLRPVEGVPIKLIVQEYRVRTASAAHWRCCCSM